MTKRGSLIQSMSELRSTMTSKRNVKKELGADDKSSMRKLAQKMYLKFESVNAPVEGSQRSLDSSKEAVSFTGQEGVLWLVGGGYAVNETHAVAIGNVMMELDCIFHAEHSSKFQNDPTMMFLFSEHLRHTKRLLEVKVLTGTKTKEIQLQGSSKLNEEGGLLNSQNLQKASSKRLSSMGKPKSPRNRTKANVDIDKMIDFLWSLQSSDGSTSTRTARRSVFQRAKGGLNESDIEGVLEAARHHLLCQPTLLKIEAPVNIVGDIHGQFQDLLRHFDNCGPPGPGNSYLFLGDYVDRGKFSIESMCLLLAYKVKYPNKVFLLRGNHENEILNKIYGFFDECKRRYSVKLFKQFCQVFECLPLAAIVASTIFCCHGGISPDLHNVNIITQIPRPMPSALCQKPGLVCDLLWSDPNSSLEPYNNGFQKNSSRGVSFMFGPDVLESFLKANHLELVCRAHQVVEDGYTFYGGRKLVTIFSAPNYCGEFDNAGAIMTVSKDLRISFKVLEAASTLKAVGVGEDSADDANITMDEKDDAATEVEMPATEPPTDIEGEGDVLAD